MIVGKAGLFGLYAVVMMAERPEQRRSAAEIARAFGISEDHVAKLLALLARAGIVDGVRGAGGGYRLAADPRRLTMLEVVEVLEGPRALDPEARAPPPGEAAAPAPASLQAVDAVLDEVQAQAYFTLKSVTISTLARR